MRAQPIGKVDVVGGWVCIHCADAYRIPIIVRRVRYGALCDICRRPSTVFKEG